MTPTQELRKIIDSLSENKRIFRWKKIAAQEIKGFVKNTNPFKMKASDYYFFVDVRSKTYQIILRGVKPNAGYAKGFSAPIDKTHLIRSHKVNFGSDQKPFWRTVKRVVDTVGGLGVEVLDASYYGVSGKPSQFFGKKSKGGKLAYGVSVMDNVAVPIYSEDGLVEWVAETNADELQNILIDAGYKALAQ